MARGKQSLRQEEAQKLWQQRGLLERTRSNLQAVINTTVVLSGDTATKLMRLADARDSITLLIAENKQQMQTIKERIPQ